jgi:hypothetical protein
MEHWTVPQMEPWNFPQTEHWAVPELVPEPNKSYQASILLPSTLRLQDIQHMRQLPLQWCTSSHSHVLESEGRPRKQHVGPQRGRQQPG